MGKHLSVSLSALALTAVLSGCAGGGASTSPPSSAGAATSAPAPATSSSASTSATELKTASSKAGQIVVDAKGMSVYYFTKDTKDSGTSACTGGCLAAWSPVTTTSATPAVKDVSAKVGTIATPDGKKQLTINGMPIYHYTKDKAPGDITGQGFNNLWYLVNPAGEMVKSAAGGY